MRLLRQLTVNDEILEKFPFKRELSMQAYLFENPEILNIDETYDEVQIYEEEITISDGGARNGGDGRIDLVASYASEHIAIIELKKDRLEEVHLEQLEGYLAKRKELHKQHRSIIDKDQTDTPGWIGILIGDSICGELESKISAGYMYQKIPIAAMTIERFRGKSGHVYVTTDTYFNNQSTSKDTTKYKYQGVTYGKGRLVLAVLKDYVAKYPNKTFSDLERDFPKALQGSAGVFKTKVIANKIFAKTTRKRHFIKDDEFISLSEGESIIAVSNQWGKDNVGKFIKHFNANIADSAGMNKIVESNA